MFVVFIGPPGSGKGTQSKRLVERLGVPHLSTGELLRAAKKQDSAVGRLAAQFMDQGLLVPDDVVLRLVREELDRPQFSDGCLFDGFPRTVEQARSLDEALSERGTPLGVVIELAADEQELTQRMLNRARKEGRADDTPETIRERMSTYSTKTSPVLDYYRGTGRLLSIDAIGTPDEVFERIWRGIESRQAAT